jgi:hypothetical protein
MPATVPATTVVTLKNADGTVTLFFQSPNGFVKYAHTFPSADVTSINTTTNGGATGATQTFVYAQDAARVDYPPSLNFEVT